MKQYMQFAAQQLTKRQMNEIRGGIKVICATYTLGDNQLINYFEGEGVTLNEAINDVAQEYEDVWVDENDCHVIEL